MMEGRFKGGIHGFPHYPPVIRGGSPGSKSINYILGALQGFFGAATGTA